MKHHGNLPPGATGAWRGLFGAAVTVAMTAAAGVTFLAASGAAAPAPVCADTALTESAAAAMAAACGRSVVADSTRSETTQITVHPDGRRTFESAVVPQRVRKNGAWTPVDLGLSRGTDGLLRPAASVADVAFSSGGTGPLVTLTRNGRKMTLSWPGGALPAPTVSGDSVTYPNVLADVDLVVRATDTGFTHVLAVKSAAAAKNPKLRAIEFATGGDAQVMQSGDGSLRAVSGGQVLAAAEPAVMWDSRTPKAAAGARSAPSADRSSAAGAGAAARVAKVDVEATGRKLVLRPDTALLDSPDAVYPVFIDPTWGVWKTKWAYANNANSTNSDISVARVGLNPDTGAVWRSYFEFSTTSNGVSLKGKHIESAYVAMVLTHSWSCGDTPSSMYLSSAITGVPKSTWSTMKLSSFADEASGHANKAGGCSDSQADMPMNYSGSTVTAQVQNAANANWNTITYAFTAHSGGSGESTQNRWKKFLPNKAALYVDYDTKPGVPNNLQVASVACPATSVLPIGTYTPTFSAVFPDADAADSLTGTFEWIKVPAGGIATVTDTVPTRETAPPAKTGISPNTRATSNAVTVVANTIYAYRAKTTDKAPYGMVSAWSPWCQFSVDTQRPTVTASVVTLPPGPGQTGTIRIESPDVDVTKFKFGWGAATTEVTASGTPRSALVTVAPPKFGRNVLNVSAVDGTLNEGVGSIEFTVGRPAGPIARWGLETYPGINQAAALADQQPTTANTPLTVSGVTWTDDARLMDGQTATFTGTTTSTTAQTSGAVVDTTKSFSVATWVKLTDTTNAYRNVVSQEGVNTSGFQVYNTRDAANWGFLLYDTDSATSTAGTVAYAPATPNVWTHIAAVYDATEKKVRMYRDGVLTGETARTAAPWASNGKFHVGWSKIGSTGVMNLGGIQIADLQVFNRVLVPQDFTGQLASDPQSGGVDEPGFLTPIEVGSWDFSAGAPCYVTNLRDTCEAPDGRAWNRWLALTRGTAMGAGRPGSSVGMRLDNEYFPEEGYTQVTTEYGRTAYKLGYLPPDSQGFERTNWQDTPVLRTDQSFTISVWAVVDEETGNYAVVSQPGTVESAMRLKYQGSQGTWQFCLADEDVNPEVGTCVTAAQPQAANDWAHLTAVYDAGAGMMRLYLNGELSQTRAVGFTPFTSGNPLAVGRTLWHGSYINNFFGGIDDLQVWQGALTDAQVLKHHQEQAPVEVPETP